MRGPGVAPASSLSVISTRAADLLVEGLALGSFPHTADGVHEEPSDLGLCLEIRRGRTEHPVRPIKSDRFLIGGDSDCDLQLGGDDMPALHSLVYREGHDFWIEMISPFPPLKVEGQVVEASVLRNGDRIQIGSFEFVVQLAGTAHSHRMDPPHKSEQARLRGPHFGMAAALKQMDSRDPSELSAEELLDSLDREIQTVEKFERRQNLAAGAFLGSVRSRFLSPTTTEFGEESSSENAPHQANGLLQELKLALQHLEERSEHLEQREVAYQEAVASLLEMQTRMARQIEAVEQRLAASQPTSEPVVEIYRRETA